MLLLPRAVRVYVATAPCNLRRSFDGLANEVRCVLGHEPLSGHVFVFINRRKTQVKLLVWTRGGFTILQKRLERGRFNFTKQIVEGMTSVRIDVHELSMLLEGLEAKNTRGAARWEPPMHREKGQEAPISVH
jgi:transposase